MSTGTITSGLGHGALIVWLLLGDWLFSPPEPAELTTISTSMVTEAEFAAMQAAAASTPDPAEVPAAAEPVEPVVETPPEPEVVEPPPEPEVVEPPPEPEVVEPPPEPEVVEPAPEPEVVPGPTAPDVDASDLPAAAELQPLQSTATSIRPKPRPAPVVSTTPTPSEEANPTAAEPVEATAPSETEPVEPVEPQFAVVEQDTGDVPETEATVDQTESLGMTSSPRPPRKPPVPAETEVAAVEEAPAEDPPAEEPAPEPTTDTAAIDDALAAALAAETTDSGTEDGGNTAPQGPPMTAGEKDGLRVAVQKCWNVGALSTEALRVTVVVNVDLDREGKPDKTSIRMAGFEGGSEAAAKVAYEVARRAILKCGAKGFQLPPEKYEEWKELTLNFDPSGMRMR
jgi:hypothetical protein